MASSASKPNHHDHHLQKTKRECCWWLIRVWVYIIYIMGDRSSSPMGVCTSTNIPSLYEYSYEWYDLYTSTTTISTCGLIWVMLIYYNYSPIMGETIVLTHTIRLQGLLSWISFFFTSREETKKENERAYIYILSVCVFSIIVILYMCGGSGRSPPILVYVYIILVGTKDAFLCDERGLAHA